MHKIIIHTAQDRYLCPATGAVYKSSWLYCIGTGSQQWDSTKCEKRATGPADATKIVSESGLIQCGVIFKYAPPLCSQESVWSAEWRSSIFAVRHSWRAMAFASVALLHHLVATPTRVDHWKSTRAPRAEEGRRNGQYVAELSHNPAGNHANQDL